MLAGIFRSALWRQNATGKENGVDDLAWITALKKRACVAFTNVKARGKNAGWTVIAFFDVGSVKRR